MAFASLALRVVALTAAGGLLSSCLAAAVGGAAVGVAGAAVGVTAKAVGMTARGAGAVAGAVLPGGHRDPQRAAEPR